MLSRSIRFLENCSQNQILGLGFLLLSIIGLINHFIAPAFTWSAFYSIPIFLVTWFVNPRIAFYFSILTAIIWLVGAIRLEKITNCYGSHIYWNIGIRMIFFGLVIYLISTLKKAYTQQKELAQIDELTKSLNRRSFLELLEKELQRSRRYKYSFTLAYFDVDNFKIVNDNYGHSTGDRLLQLVVRQAKISIRSIDSVGRLGGDEFAVLLLETDYETGHRVLQRLQQQLMTAIKLEGFPVSFSIGAITFQNFPESIERMIEQVDHLMYEVKNEGKDSLKHELY